MNKLFFTLFLLSIPFTDSYAQHSFRCFAPSPKEQLPDEETLLLSVNENLPLAEKISRHLGIPLGSALVKKFKNGEIRVEIEEDLRNKNVLIVQPGCHPSQNVNENLIELYLLVRSMKRASAATVTAVVPYYGSGKREKSFMGKIPVSAADVALFLEIAGVDRVVTMDLQCGQIQGFFRNMPVDNLYAASTFVPYFATKELQNVVVVSPDGNGIERMKNFAEGLERYGIPTGTALVGDVGQGLDPVESMIVIGDVKNADVILVDDLCDATGRLLKAAKLLRDLGAHRIFAVVTQPIFSESILEQIGDSVIEEMVIADTMPLREIAPPNVRCIPVPSLLGRTIGRTVVGESLAELFP